MIRVRINTATNARRPGFCKLNTHLLTKSEYINLIRKQSQTPKRRMKVRTILTKLYYRTLSRCKWKRPQSSMPKRKSHTSNRRNFFWEKRPGTFRGLSNAGFWTTTTRPQVRRRTDSNKQKLDNDFRLMPRVVYTGRLVLTEEKLNIMTSSWLSDALPSTLRKPYLTR